MISYRTVVLNAILRFGQISLLILFSCLFESCSGNISSLREEATRHMVMVNKHGHLVKPKVNKTTGIYSSPTKVDKDEIDKHFNNMFSHIGEEAKKNEAIKDDQGRIKILIFIHGGLNSHQSGLKRTLALAHEMSDSGNDSYYPIFINWNSSLLTSYNDHVFYLRQGKYQSTVGPFLFPFYFAADLARSVVRAPVVWSFQLVNYVAAIPGVTIKSEREADDALEEYELHHEGHSGKKGSDPSHSEVALYLGRDATTNWEKAYVLTTGFITFAPKMVISPFVDAFGKSAWDVMHRRTHLMFHTDREYMPGEPDYDNRKDHKEWMRAEEGVGGVSHFMRFLEKKMKTRNYSITLIGHSMGTIVLNEILNRFHDIEFDNLVYMAAACTVREYQNSVFPYLAEHKHTKFHHLTLNQRSEMGERMPILPILDLPPRGSLLIWIDEFLSSPRTRLDLTAGRFKNLLVSLHDTPIDQRSRISIKAFGAGCVLKDRAPLRHGDFAEFEFWKKSFWATTHQEQPEAPKRWRMKK